MKTLHALKKNIENIDEKKFEDMKNIILMGLTSESTDLEEEFENDSQKSQAPNHAENGPTNAATQTYQRERGVTSGDQKIDRGMVGQPKKFLDAGRMKTVIKSGNQVEENESRPINGDADDLVSITSEGCQSQ